MELYAPVIVKIAGQIQQALSSGNVEEYDRLMVLLAEKVVVHAKLKEENESPS